MRTVILSDVISDAICLIVMLFLWIQNRKGWAGIGFWLVDFIFQFLAVLLILMRGLVPDILSMVVSNSLIIGGTILLYIGLERYLEKGNRQYLNILFLGFFIAVHTYFSVVQPSLPARNVNFSVGMLFICFQCSWLMLRRVDSEKRPDTIVVGVVFAFYCLVSVVRLFIELLLPASIELFASYVYDTFVVLTYQMLFIMLTFALFLMVQRRLNKALEKDIAERVLAEENLKKTEDKLSTALQNIPDAIIITILDNGKITEANESFFRIFKYDKEEIIGKTTIELNLYAKMADRDRFVDELQRNGRVFHFVTDFRTKSGEVFPGVVSGEVIRIEESLYILSVIHDITERKQAEAALFESETRYRRLVEDINDVIFEMNGEGIVDFISQAIIPILGYSPAEITGEKFEKFVYPGDLSLLKSRFKLVLAGNIQPTEFRLLHKSGIPVWVRSSSRPIYEDDRPVGMRGVLANISETKQAEENLRAANAKLEALWSVSSLADADVKTTCDHILATIGRMTSSEYGFYGFINTDETVMTIHSWSGEAMKDCHMVDKPVNFPISESGIWAEAIRRREPLIMNNYNVVHPAKKGLPVGHVALSNFLVVPFFAHAKIVAVAAVANRQTPYGQEDVNQITAFLTSIQAIIDGKRSEKALQDSEAKFRKIFETLGIGISLVSLDGKFLSGNPAILGLLGYTLEEYTRLTIKEISYPDDVDIDLDLFRDMIDGKLDSYSIEKRNLRKNGQYVWGNLTCTIVRDEKGNPQFQIGMFEDISERKQAEAEKEKLQEQLLQAQKMESIGRLAGGVAHDFNNLLGVIIGHTEVAMKKISPRQAVYADLDEILSAAARSAELTRQLLTFARKQTVTPKVIDLNKTISNLLGMFRRLIGENIELEWRPGDSIWHVFMDPSQIDQVLANLLVNARDAIIGVGWVAIETCNIIIDDEFCAQHPGFISGEYTQLAVRDNGTGMNNETLSHLFEPFFTTKDIGKGTGLGLATVYGIVIQNNGYITVFSEPGLGTTFNVYLPRVETEEPPVCYPDVVETPLGRAEMVLMVEDEEALLELGKETLENLGYVVLAAGTPEEALKLAREHVSEIQLLITDVVMPGMNGRLLAEQIGVIQPGLKCLFMSGYTADIISDHGVLPEGITFIQKPFMLKDLATKVRQAMEK